ncbi:hypothetical protein [Streptomyces sp. NPDC060002]|uniref:hypothetical protein n=1 Tax=Streptomyces sp. NPDC060002 TaxID=3347033 RepID=UPI00368C17A7
MDVTMQNDLTGDDLFSYVLLLRSGPTARKYILCEGDSDCAVLDPHLEEDLCETLPGYGKSSVLDAIKIVEQQQMRGVAALIDRDWEKDEISIPVVAVQTDHYDIDATVFYSGDVCRRVVYSFCDRASVRNFLQVGGWASPVEPATLLAFPIGVLRKLNYEHGWGLRFSDTPFSEVALPDATGVDLVKTVSSALARAKKARIMPSDIPAVAALANSEMKSVTDPTAYCCGHDLNASLAYLMSQKWRGRINRKTLEKAMRAAFSCKEIAVTKMRAGLPVALRCSPEDLYVCG